jgi:hypothetical protein
MCETLQIVALIGHYFICDRFQVLTAASVKFAVFWDTAPCSLVEVDRRFRGEYYLYHEGDDNSDSTHLWNVSLLHRDYTALRPRRLSF